MCACAVLGAGNGGQLLTAVLKQMGHEVRLWDLFPDVVDGIRKRGSICASGAVEASERPDVVSTDLSEVLDGVEMVFIVTPASAHRALAERIVPWMLEFLER